MDIVRDNVTDQHYQTCVFDIYDHNGIVYSDAEKNYVYQVHSQSSSSSNSTSTGVIAETQTAGEVQWGSTLHANKCIRSASSAHFTSSY